MESQIHKHETYGTVDSALFYAVHIPPSWKSSSPSKLALNVKSSQGQTKLWAVLDQCLAVLLLKTKGRRKEHLQVERNTVGTKPRMENLGTVLD